MLNWFYFNLEGDGNKQVTCSFQTTCKMELNIDIVYKEKFSFHKFGTECLTMYPKSYHGYESWDGAVTVSSYQGFI